MKKARVAACAAVILLAMTSGFLYGKEAEPPKSLARMVMDAEFDIAVDVTEGKARVSRGEPASGLSEKATVALDRLAGFYEKAPSDPAILRELSSRALRIYQVNHMDDGASAAACEATARLALIQVQQNQRVIELLQQIVRSRPAPR